MYHENKTESTTTGIESLNLQLGKKVEKVCRQIFAHPFDIIIITDNQSILIENIES